MPDSPPLNVLKFVGDEPEERSIYACDCGCVSFRLFDSGDVQCAKCGQWMDEVHVDFGTGEETPNDPKLSDSGPGARA